MILKTIIKIKKNKKGVAFALSQIAGFIIMVVSLLVILMLMFGGPAGLLNKIKDLVHEYSDSVYDGLGEERGPVEQEATQDASTRHSQLVDFIRNPPNSTPCIKGIRLADIGRDYSLRIIQNGRNLAIELLSGTNVGLTSGTIHERTTLVNRNICVVGHSREVNEAFINRWIIGQEHICSNAGSEITRLTEEIRELETELSSLEHRQEHAGECMREIISTRDEGLTRCVEYYEALNPTEVNRVAEISNLLRQKRTRINSMQDSLTGSNCPGTYTQINNALLTRNQFATSGREPVNLMHNDGNVFIYYPGDGNVCFIPTIFDVIDNPFADNCRVEGDYIDDECQSELFQRMITVDGVMCESR